MFPPLNKVNKYLFVIIMIEIWSSYQMLHDFNGERGYFVFVDIDESLYDAAHIVILRITYKIQHFQHELLNVSADVFLNC